MVLEHKDLSRLLETAIVAARAGGQHALEKIDYAKSAVKNGNELVTDADTQCQRIIIEGIKESYSDHGFLAEEGTGGGIFKQSPRGSDELWWVIDPIDGTNNFAKRIPLFATSIAVMHKGEPVVGVIFLPATDSMFTAVKAQEAQLNGRRITVSAEKLTDFSCVGLYSHFKKPTPDWACRLLQRTKARNLGTTAVQLSYVANGSLVGTIAGSQKLWDIAAGALIVESAGGIVSDWNGEKVFPVDLDAYEGGQLAVLAANKKAQPELLELLKS